MQEEVKSFSCVQLFVTLWTTQSMEFSRPEYWSRWLFPSPGDLHNPGIEHRSPTLQADSLPAEPPGKPKNTGVGSLSFSGGSSRPRNQTRVSCMQVDSLPTDLSEKSIYLEKNHNAKRYMYPQCSTQHCSQQPGHGSNPNVHQQRIEIQKICYISIMEYYSTIKRNEIGSS